MGINTDDYAKSLDVWETDNAKIIAWINNSISYSIGAQLAKYETSNEIDEEEFKEEQNSVACLIHMLYNDDLEEMLKSNHRHNYGLDILLLSVDEGITGYRDDSLENVKRNEIEVVDLLVSYQRGEKIGLFDGAGVGKTRFIMELMINNIGKDCFYQCSCYRIGYEALLCGYGIAGVQVGLRQN
ncbi:hypothetical protein ZIOFF_073219 [Zingiber officinale]|uniref:Uncharacterized protein n=1 Tax=Zingiber officinale TaxID=94328 RepID=A0A8J5BWU3_ZINOF|nr:hypothetical protein ZIOFF_073219 [Zingiber officinale]